MKPSFCQKYAKKNLTGKRRGLIINVKKKLILDKASVKGIIYIIITPLCFCSIYVPKGGGRPERGLNRR